MSWVGMILYKICESGDTDINETVLPVFHSIKGYENYQYDANRNIITNFSNIQTLTVDC